MFVRQLVSLLQLVRLVLRWSNRCKANGFLGSILLRLTMLLCINASVVVVSSAPAKSYYGMTVLGRLLVSGELPEIREKSTARGLRGRVVCPCEL